MAAEREEHHETALMRIAGAPKPPSAYLDEKREQEHKKEVKKVPRTATGESAQDLLGSWITWVQDGTGVPLPPQTINRISKQIKGLIIAQYSASHIKHGLAIWTLQKMENPLLSPQALDDLTWKYATDTSHQASTWRRKVKSRIQEVTQTARDAKAIREQESLDAHRNVIEEQQRLRERGL